MSPQKITAPTGMKLSCKGWHQEAALRMLMNNLDARVAEDPENLIVYGGTGKAAKKRWRAALEKIERTQPKNKKKRKVL